MISNTSSGDIVKLNASITNQNGDCIEFNGVDNITFDCDGYIIGGDGNSSGGPIGIYLSDSNGGSNNTIIKDCINVSYFWNGIEIDHSHNNTLVNITVDNNLYKGIHIDDSSNNTLTNITANKNWIGIDLYYDSSNNTMKNVNITKNISTAEYEQQMGLYVSGNSLQEFVHNIDTSNTVNGKTIQYFDGTYRACPDNQTLDYNTSASFVGLAGCDNVTINNTNANDQILLAHTNNSLVTNSMVNYSNVGLYLYSSYYNNITNFTGLRNMDAGILFWYSLYNIITNTTVNNNSDGIEFYSSFYNELTNVTANNNSYGVAFYSCNNNTLTNITANENFVGIGFYPGESNNITNLNASDNGKGVEIEDDSYYNIIKDSWVDSSTTCGICINSTSNNTIINITVYSNSQAGIYISYSENVNLNNITANNNNNYGIQIEDSTNITMRNSTITKQVQRRGLYVFGTSPSEYVHDIDTSNKVNGKLIQYFDGTYRTCPDNQTLDYNTSASFVGLAGCYNVTITNTDVNDHILLAYTNNSLLTNSSVNDSYYGIFLYRSSNNTISNTTAHNNGAYAIWTSSSCYNNTFTTIYTSYNDWCGILFQSDHNILTDITGIKNDGGLIELVYGNDNSMTDIEANDNWWGLLIWVSDNNTLVNITAEDSGGEGIYILDSINNTFINVTSINNNGGSLAINNTHNNAFINVIANSYLYIGVILYYSDNNTFTNITANNQDYGIDIYSSNNNTFTNINASKNQDYGFDITNSDNNTFTNVTVNYTKYFMAFRLTSSSNNNITNITASGNNKTLYFDGDSDSNIIKDSWIEDSETCGVCFEHSGSNYPQNNLIYNNYFSNTMNFKSTSTQNANLWNTTKTAGTNIIGGPYIGGNYWSDYTGQDTDGDKIGDTPHVLDSNNTDYLPLTFTTYTPPPPPGNGFTGTLYGGSLPETEEADYTSDVIYEGETIEVIVNETDIPVSNITFVVGETVVNASLDVQEEETKPSDVSQPPGDVYGYFTINTSISDDQISSAYVHFSVERSWIEDNNIDPEDVVLWRYHNNNWEYTETDIEGSDSEYYYYVSLIPGFSLFVITYQELACIPDSRRCSDDEVQRCKSDGSVWQTIETCEYGCDNESISCKPREGICEPGETRCDGNVLQKCSTDGYTWETLETCEYWCVDNKCVRVSDYYIGIAVILIVLILLIIIELRPRLKKRGLSPI
ncbi:MAG: right-handed parallel beta-helix repeat-containing protein [Candidatus Aenigmatarchaeota archaeon]|nr:MAG: right-handed parallel beta-helix repeat-containing protein [Candidatus Aenigmarchaeota archaeon]